MTAPTGPTGHSVPSARTQPPPPPAEAVLGAAAELYVAMHRDPELSGAEERTAARFAAALTAAGLTVERGIGGHGVVGVLRNGLGPVVTVRAELDALPVREDTGLPYASTATAPGPDGAPVPVMHACGHDLHLACVAGAVQMLAAAAGEWRGTLVVVGQPAEETLTGAAAMLADGLYRRFPAPSVVLAQHAAPLPAGMVAHAEGPLLAASATLEVVLHGRGGHASAPQLAADPVVTAAAVVLRLQTVVSRETSPAEPLVVTVGSVRAGGPGNVIPESATLQVTVRAFSEAALARATAAVRRIAAAESAASPDPLPPAPDIRELSRSAVTAPDPRLTAALRDVHLAAFGPGRVTRWQPSMATEDFPLYGDGGLGLHGVPGIRLGYWMLGTVGPREWAQAAGGAPGASAADRLAALAPNHSPRFRPHPRLSLEAGITAMAAAVRAQMVSVKVASEPSPADGGDVPQSSEGPW